MWKINGVTVLVLVISLLSGCSSGLDEGSARDAFTNMCNAVRDQNSSALYEMLSDDIKSRGSKEQLMRDLETGLNFELLGQRIDRCEVEAVTVRNNSQSDAPIAEGQITWFSNSGEQSSGTTTLIGENGAWKLQD
jgi:hypothetical protein